MNQPKPKGKPGRPPGSISRMSMADRVKAAETGKLPHEILLDIARGEVMFTKRLNDVTGETIAEAQYITMEQRQQAAVQAAPYYAPKISTVEVIQGVSDENLDEIIARAAAEAGVSLGPDGEGEEGEGAEGDAASQRPRRRIAI